MWGKKPEDFNFWEKDNASLLAFPALEYIEVMIVDQHDPEWLELHQNGIRDHIDPKAFL